LLGQLAFFFLVLFVGLLFLTLFLIFLAAFVSHHFSPFPCCPKYIPAALFPATKEAVLPFLFNLTYFSNSVNYNFPGDPGPAPVKKLLSVKGVSPAFGWIIIILCGG
jgi:hypothetical protein